MSSSVMKFPSEWKVIIHSCSKPPSRYCKPSNFSNYSNDSNAPNLPFQYLLGGAITILKNDELRQWVSDDIAYEMKNIWLVSTHPVGICVSIHIFRVKIMIHQWIFSIAGVIAENQLEKHRWNIVSYDTRLNGIHSILPSQLVPSIAENQLVW